MTDSLSTLTAISPLDGRYFKKTNELGNFFSEFALMRYRLFIEIEWLKSIAANSQIEQAPNFSDTALNELDRLYQQFDLEQAQKIKVIEATTNHDVKAIEYYLKEQIKNQPELNRASEFIHFACTSEDINNLAHALMLKDARKCIFLPAMDQIIDKLDRLSNQYADQAMLARTHGQTASPTTMGKELRNVYLRLLKQRQLFSNSPLLGKINGAVGNYNAHIVAYPDIDWPEYSKNFVSTLGLDWNPYTTQIEPHDYMAELFHAMARFNTILLDLDHDIWSYISIGYFRQKTVSGEVGSSTMPHKVNPIDFENSEGNLGLANAILYHLASKLPISRWQRDLSDSTVLRNVGVGTGYSLLAYQSTLNGLNKLQINSQALSNDLNNSWEVLAEAIQTVMRKQGVEQAYEKLKALTRGQDKIDQQVLIEFIHSLELPETEKQALLTLSPHSYIGLATSLARCKNNIL